MKRIVFLSGGLIVILALLTVRERLILKEINSLEREISSQITVSIQSAHSFERLQQLSRSSSVYDRYLEPVFVIAQRLLWPPVRQSVLLAWEKDVHRRVEDTMYLKTIALGDEIKQQVDQIRNTEEPSSDRMLSLAKVIQELNTPAERMELIEREIEDIKNSIKSEDDKTLSKVKSVGLARLKELKSIVDGKQELEMAEYLASPVFYQEIQKPVAEEILSIRQTSLRKNTWDEFQTKMYSILNHKSRQLALSREEEPEDESVNALAELLKREYEKSVDRDQVAQPTPHSPSNSDFYK